MKAHVLSTAVLTLLFFSAINLNAQTTIHPSTQPMERGGAFEIERIISVWKHCEGEGTGTDKVYRSYQDNLYSSEPATQPTGNTVDPNCKEFYLQPWGEYQEFVGSTATITASGSYVVDQDNNVVVTLSSGKKLLLITDQLMQGILIMREM